MPVKTINTNFTQQTPRVRYENTGGNVPIEDLINLGNQQINNETKNLERAREGFASLVNVTDTITNMTVENDFQIDQLNKLKDQYGLTENVIDGLTENDRKNKGMMAALEQRASSMANSPEYREILRQQKLAQEFKDYVVELEGVSPVLAWRAQGHFIENYSDLTSDKVNSQRSQGGFYGARLLNREEFKIMDIDKEFDELVARQAKTKNLTYKKSPDGKFTEVYTADGFKMSDAEVKSTLKQAMKDRAASDPVYKHNMEAFAGINSGGSWDLDDNDDLLDKFISEKYKDNLDETVAIRNTPAARGGRTKSDKITVLDTLLEEYPNMNLSKTEANKLRSLDPKAIGKSSINKKGELVVEYKLTLGAKNFSKMFIKLDGDGSIPTPEAPNPRGSSIQDDLASIGGSEIDGKYVVPGGMSKSQRSTLRKVLIDLGVDSAKVNSYKNIKNLSNLPGMTWDSGSNTLEIDVSKLETNKQAPAATTPAAPVKSPTGKKTTQPDGSIG